MTVNSTGHKDAWQAWMNSSGWNKAYNALGSFLKYRYDLKHDVAMKKAREAFPIHSEPLELRWDVPGERVSVSPQEETEAYLAEKADGTKSEQIDWIHRNIDIDDVKDVDVESCPGLKAFKTWKMLAGNYAAKMDWLKEIHKQGVKADSKTEAKSGGSDLRDLEELLQRVDKLNEGMKLEGLVQ